MADTLYLKDGTVEVITGTPKECLLALIEDKLGWDCARLFERLTRFAGVDLEADDEEEWERIADGYRWLCQSTVEELEGLESLIETHGKKMTKQYIRSQVERIRKNLWENL